MFKGGVTKKSLKFCSDDICNYANSPPEYQKLAFLIFRNFRFFPRRHVSGLPTVSLGESDKLTDFSLFIFFLLYVLGGGGSSPLIWVTKGGGTKKMKKKLLMKRGVIIYYRSYPSNPTSPLSTIKNER